MKVSIITATLNVDGTLAEAAESLFAQTHTDIEYIVVDGGSTDGTQELVRSFGDKVATFISEPDHGIYDAINKGFAKSSGEVVGLLHADDMFAGPETIEKIVQQFRTSQCDAMYGDLQYVHRSNPSRVIRQWNSGPFLPGMISRGWMPPHPTLFIRREVFLKHGPYNLRYKTAADYDFMLRILKDNQLRIGYLPEVLVRMRMGGASNRGLGELIRKSREDMLIMKSHQLPFPLFALLSKNFSKISQFFRN